MSNDNDKIEDTEAGLEEFSNSVVGSENLETTENFVDEEEALRLEFQKAVENTADQRANTPFQIAALTHSRMCGPALQEIDNISGGAAKRILKYLIAYPFYVKELNAQDKQVEGIAQVCDRLVHTKFTMAMCAAIEKEARVTAAIQKQEDAIMEIPQEILSNPEENKE